VNPNAAQIDGATCYPDLQSVPGELDGVVVTTHPDRAIEIVRQAAARGVHRVWFHRSFGQGSVSHVAVNEAKRLNLMTIVGGCPMMYLRPRSPRDAVAVQRGASPAPATLSGATAKL
jgi:predicted CoA-binding protein